MIALSDYFKNQVLCRVGNVFLLPTVSGLQKNVFGLNLMALTQDSDLL